MRHYEIVVVIHPEQRERVAAMADGYQKIVADSGGAVHRFEDWGRRQLSYPIQKQRYAHYVLMNVECGNDVLATLQENFRFSDAILRSLVVRCEKARTVPSPVMKKITEIKEIKEKEAEAAQ